MATSAHSLKKRVVCWSNLAGELLTLIFERIIAKGEDLSNLYQCLSICSSWRLVAKELWHTIIPPIPMLVYHHEEDPARAHLYTVDLSVHNKAITVLRFLDYSTSTTISTTVSEKPYTIFLPDHDDGIKPEIVCSYRGWLLVTDVIKNFIFSLYLHNSMSKAFVKLPSPPPWIRTWKSLIGSRFITSSDPLTDPNFMIFVLFESIQDDHTETFLAFCKPNIQLGDGWTLLGELTNCPKDMIFYKGEFYTIDREDNGTLFIYNNVNFIDCGSKISQNIVAPARKFPLDWDNYVTFHLVESTRGELLMVERILMETEDYGVRSKSFRVYKLDTRKNGWEEISEFDRNQALFLSPNESMFFPTDEQQYKSNCIYFFDEDSDWYMDAYGVYDLGNRTVEHFDFIPPIVKGTKARFHMLYRP